MKLLETRQQTMGTDLARDLLLKVSSLHVEQVHLT